MAIDVKLILDETDLLVSSMEKGTELGRSGEYEQAIEAFTGAIISAGRLFQKDEEVGRKLRLDQTILVAKGYQIKALHQMMEQSPSNRGKYFAEMTRIARGDLTMKNPYMAGIIEAMQEWKDCEDAGDFYTRPRKD